MLKIVAQSTKQAMQHPRYTPLRHEPSRRHCSYAHRTFAPRGFALISIITLLVLVALVCLGLLTLSSISLRGAQKAEAQTRAQANARLALMMALGELQKELGPDQRVTATSGILEAPSASPASLKHDRLTGVWKSRDDTLSGVPPDYDRNQSFRKWLVSSSRPQDLTSTQFASAGNFQDPVELVGTRTPSASGSVPILAVEADRITMPGTSVADRGKLAWWIGDENCKGFLNPVASELQKAGSSVSDVLAHTCTPGAYGMQAVDKDFPANTNTTAKILTHGQVSLASAQDQATTAAWFHDLSPFPRSILCNVTKGGLRQDLSLFLEQSSLDSPPTWPGIPPSGPLGPNGQIALSGLGVNEYDVLPWKQLAAWSRLRKNVSMVNGRPTLVARKGPSAAQPSDAANPRWNAGVLRPTPIPIRHLLFMSCGTVEIAPGQFSPRLYAYPVMVLWNPYNVDLMTEEINVLFNNMPMEFQFWKNGTQAGIYKWKQNSGLQPYFDQPQTIKAGETKVFTPSLWAWDGGLHITHKMATTPIVYTRTRGSENGAVGAGGEWGNSNRAGDAQITITGVTGDSLEIRPAVKGFNLGTGAGMAGDQASFDIRSHHTALEGANWGAFLWHSKFAWRFETNGPWSPDKTSQQPYLKDKFEDLKNAPRPFMVLDITLKTLDELEIPNKTWSHCIPGHPFQGVTNIGGITPDFLNTYKLTFHTVSDPIGVMQYLQLHPTDQTQTYFGSSNFPTDGQSRIADVEIPLAPLTSLAQLQNLPQGSIDNLYSSGFYFQNHAIGNSFASPGVPSNKVSSDDSPPFWLDRYYNANGGTISGQKFPIGALHTRPNMDRSYAANQLLWDDYFFSSMAPKDGVLTAGPETIDKIVQDFYLQGKPLPNERYKPYFNKAAAHIVTDLVAGTSPTATGYQKVAGSLMVDGGFNVNSVSVNAWKTLLASLHKRPMTIMETTGGPKVQPEGKFIVSRFTMPNGPSADATTGKAGMDLRWIGYRELTETQIDTLAHAIVRQVKKRGPFRSLGEFINRRLGAESDELTRYGALQAALEDQAVDINADYRAKSIDAAFLQQNGVAYPNPTAATGSRYQGAPCYVTQADLLGPIAPILNARSDTFVIRAYGEATGRDGHPAARAWCEAVVQRVPDYINTTDAPETAAKDLLAPVNKLFGRRLKIAHFRWLAANEI